MATSSSIGIPAPQLPAWLRGRWSIDRDVDEGRGRFSGVATFEAQADGTIRWSEHGTLRLDDFEGPVRRELVLHRADPWEVRFDDGAVFHALDLASGRCAAEHVCGPDLYRGTFDVVSANELLVRWSVTGPGRDDSIVSRYRRLG